MVDWRSSLDLLDSLINEEDEEEKEEEEELFLFLSSENPMPKRELKEKIIQSNWIVRVHLKYFLF